MGQEAKVGEKREMKAEDEDGKKGEKRGLKKRRPLKSKYNTI